MAAPATERDRIPARGPGPRPGRVAIAAALRAVVAVACVALAPGAVAMEWEVHDDVVVSLGGEYRLRVHGATEVIAYRTPERATRQEEHRIDDGVWVEQRLRLEPKVTLFEQLDLNLMVDYLDGNVSNPPGDIDFLRFSESPTVDENGRDLDDVRVQRAWAEWRAPFGLLRFGRQPSHIGLGLLSHDGATDLSPFGDAVIADTYDRVLFGTKPISVVRGLLGQEPGVDFDPDADPVTIGVGYDFGVVEDNVAKRGDDLDQLLIGLIVHVGEHDEIGFFAVHREQQHDDRLRPRRFQPSDEYLDAWILQTTGRLSTELGVAGGLEVELAWEIAYATGETNFTASPSLQRPEDPFPVNDVEQLGGVVRLTGTWDTGSLRLEGGYASGDSNRLDDEVNDFRFHRNYNVGLILFDDLLGALTAAQSFNVIDALGEGGPVPLLGADFLVSNGSVTNSVYVFPTLSLSPREDLELRLGVLWAQAVEKLVDPFNDAFLGSGGAGEVNPYGGDASEKDLGVEVDAGVHWALPLELADAVGATPRPGGETLLLGLEYGHLFPGAAFADEHGDRIPDIDKVSVRATLAW